MVLDDARREIGRNGWRSEVVACRKDGVAVPLAVNTNAILASDGRSEAVVSVVQDVSAERAFRRSCSEPSVWPLSAVWAAVSRMKRTMRSPPSSGQTEHVDQLDQEGLRRALSRVDQQARRIADIVQGVLGFARPRPLRTEARRPGIGDARDGGVGSSTSCSRSRWDTATTPICRPLWPIVRRFSRCC
jgi:hypothetical protein